MYVRVISYMLCSVYEKEQRKVILGGLDNYFQFLVWTGDSIWISKGIKLNNVERQSVLYYYEISTCLRLSSVITDNQMWNRNINIWELNVSKEVIKRVGWERERESSVWQPTIGEAYYGLLFSSVYSHLLSTLLYLPLHHTDTLRTVSAVKCCLGHPCNMTSQLWSSTFIVTFQILINILTLKEWSENDKDHRFIMYFKDWLCSSWDSTRSLLRKPLAVLISIKTSGRDIRMVAKNAMR